MSRIVPGLRKLRSELTRRKALVDTAAADVAWAKRMKDGTNRVYDLEQKLELLCDRTRRTREALQKLEAEASTAWEEPVQEQANERRDRHSTTESKEKDYFKFTLEPGGE